MIIIYYDKGDVMIYETLEEAIAAAQEFSEVMETVVKITKCEGGYEFFGMGEIVQVIE